MDPLKSPDFLEGDIIVTPVSRHYAIGRIRATGIQTHLTDKKDRAEAPRT
jgi:hypothetical protein